MNDEPERRRVRIECEDGFAVDVEVGSREEAIALLLEVAVAGALATNDVDLTVDELLDY